METDDGRPLAALVNYACHGVCLSGKWRRFSSDFVGPMREVIEQVTGASALYIQGATGNMNPILMGDDYKNARATGVKLAGEVLKVWETITPVEARGLGAAYEEVQLPALRYASKERAASTLDACRRELEQAQGKAVESGQLRWTKTRIKRAEAALRSWETGELPPPLPARLYAVRFGPAAIATSGGEIFAQIGVEVKRRSPIPDTLYAAYANGSVGYVPTPDAYPEGGYEVDSACRVDPGAAGIITEGCLRALGRVGAAG
jgi:hypothetical protein